MLLDVWGWVCAVAGPVVSIPQVARLLRSRTSAGLSLLMWQLNIACAVAWSFHGLRADAPNIVAPNVLLGVAAVLVVFDSRVGGLGWRYSADFGWLISLASIPGLLWLVNGREPSRSLAGANDAASGDGIARVTPWRWLMRWVVMLAVLWALGIAILSCFVQSRSDSMIANNPTLWHQVQSWFTLL